MADSSVLVRIPIRRHKEPGVELRPPVRFEGPHHQMTVAYREYQRWMGKPLTIERLAITVGRKKHGSGLTWLPPRHEGGRINEHMTREKRGRQFTAQSSRKPFQNFAGKGCSGVQ